MSDISGAPPPAEAPQGGQGEAPINPNPVGSPQPVGSQAPPAPVGDMEGGKGRPESRREALRNAFEKAQERPGAAKPRIGHNNPPEPTPKEKEQPPLNLRRPPPPEKAEAEPKEPAPRAEHGHFAPRQAPGQAPPPGAQAPARSAHSPLPDTAPYRDPPQRFSEAARADWAGAPESVRGAVHGMMREFSGAYQAYRSDHEAMNEIRPFHDLATQHGTNLKTALTNYWNMEQKLRADPIAGLDLLVNNLNLQTPQGQRLGLRDVAYHVLSQTPDQLQALQGKQAQSAQSHQIGQLHQTVQALTQGFQQLHQERQYVYTSAQVDQFAQTHPRVDELGDLIAYEISLGHDLPTAYRRAELLRPTQAAQTRTTPAQTRSRSISGAPDTGPSDGQRSRSDKPIGRRDAIERAIKRVNGSV